MEKDQFAKVVLKNGNFIFTKDVKHYLPEELLCGLLSRRQADLC